MSDLHPTGIPSRANVGGPTIVAGDVISAIGIAPLALIGAPDLSPGEVEVRPTTVPTSLVVGRPRLGSHASFTATGIASAAAVGSPTLIYTLNPNGIQSRTRQLGVTTLFFGPAPPIVETIIDFIPFDFSPLDVDPYLEHITSYHRGKPDFTALVYALTAPAVVLRQFNDSLTTAFDLDVCVGVQLDHVGEWIGRSRRINIVIPSTWFSFDIEGLGFDQAHWLGPFDPLESAIMLDDDTYRFILRRKIEANSWDGTFTTFAATFQKIADRYSVLIYLEDRQRMSIIFAIARRLPNALPRALLFGPYIPMKAAGVAVFHYLPSVIDVPFFGFDSDGFYISGFDVGAWGLQVTD